jgi:uncharacterized delta-60 repeat protein
VSLPRKSLAFLFVCVVTFSAAAVAQAAPGDLDAAFGTAGISTIASGPDFDDAEIRDIAVAPDGKIVIVGRSAGAADTYAFILRLLPTGARDPGFGTEGAVLTRLGPEFAQFNSVAVQSNNRIVVGGAVRSTGLDSPVVARFTEDGGLDPTFNPLGVMPGAIINTGISVNDTIFDALVMRPDGSIIGTGTINASQRYWVTQSVTSTGVLDTTFNGSGWHSTSFPGNDGEPLDVVARPDGRTVACGYAPTNSSDQVNDAFVGFSSVGEYDGQFNGNGFLVKPDALTNNQCRAMALQSDGKIVAASFSTDGSSSNWLLLTRLNANGTPDSSFANGGQYIDDRSEQVSFPTDLVIQPAGRILAVGRGRVASVNGFTVWARQPDGAADISFGDKGFVHHAVEGGGWPDAAALLGDERLFMAGSNSLGLRVMSVKLKPDVIPGSFPSSARAKITSPSKSKLKRSKVKRISGTATATNAALGRVEVAILRSGPRKSKKCLWLKSNKAKFRSVRKTKAGCKRQVWLRASGTAKWSLKLRKSLSVGKYTIYARATPNGGTPEAKFNRSLRNYRTIKLTR